MAQLQHSLQFSLQLLQQRVVALMIFLSKKQKSKIKIRALRLRLSSVSDEVLFFSINFFLNPIFCFLYDYVIEDSLIYSFVNNFYSLRLFSKNCFEAAKKRRTEAAFSIATIQNVPL